MDFVDVDSAKFEAYAAKSHGPMGWVHGREARLLAAEEARLAAMADYSLLISRAEADLFAQRLGASAHARIEVLGNGIDPITLTRFRSAPNASWRKRAGRV
jgi:hypothetical protein